jgi:hypothetical protein
MFEEELDETQRHLESDEPVDEANETRLPESLHQLAGILSQAA